jgi:hypothetical protein
MRALRLAALLVGTYTSATASAIPNSLTVVIFDHAGVSHIILVSAVKEARRVFRTSGVETEWILCNPVEGCYVPERFVQVKILPHPVQSTPISPHGLGSTNTCTATEHCAASYVFYNRILDFADDASAPADLALAYVMVHEIGHLLGLGHRPGGIMTAGFTPHDLRRAAAGWLCFGDDDARELRAAIARSPRTSDSSRHIKLAGWRGEFSE